MGRSTETCSDCVNGCPFDFGCYADEEPEHSATVTSFYLDKYEVTVGRFRAFVDAYESGWRPSAGQGANPAVEAAQGLAVGATGWQSAWDMELPSTGYQGAAGDNSLEDRITCEPETETWTNPAAGNEDYAINCINWYEAFAFCIWDNGRLPTEAEWEYAAAGGNENRVYPWGNNLTEPLPANYGDNHTTPFLSVGSEPLGNGRWGHADLSGSVWEWVLDWFNPAYYTDTQTGCSDCANLTNAAGRVRRGGAWSYSYSVLRTARRAEYPPADHHQLFGIRCARNQ